MPRHILALGLVAIALLGLAWGVLPARRGSALGAQGETLRFTISPAPVGPDAPVLWERVQLENRARDEGLVGSGGALALAFAEPGSYTVSLRDAAPRFVSCLVASIFCTQRSLWHRLPEARRRPGV